MRLGGVLVNERSPMPPVDTWNCWVPVASLRVLFAFCGWKISTLCCDPDRRMRTSCLSHRSIHGLAAVRLEWLLVLLVQYGSCHATTRCLPRARAAARSWSIQAVAAATLPLS